MTATMNTPATLDKTTTITQLDAILRHETHYTDSVESAFDRVCWFLNYCGYCADNVDDTDWSGTSGCVSFRLYAKTASGCISRTGHKVYVSWAVLSDGVEMTAFVG